MTLRKWNYEKREYEPYEIPNDWDVKTYSEDMDEMVTCPHCGKDFCFGDGYTSHEIHTEHGFGYTVCEECYFGQEYERYMRYKG